MSDTDILESLLVNALAARDAGATVDLDELCRDHPELRDELAAALAIGSDLRAMHRHSAVARDLVGTTIANRYRLVELIGRGAAGSVYRCVDAELGREVALKLLDDFDGANSSRTERFLREAEVLAQHEHRSIVRIYDRGRAEDGRLFLVTELLHGVSLAAVLEAACAAMPRGPSPAGFAQPAWLHDLLPGLHGEHGFLRRAVQWVAQLADGLAIAHANGVFHRDVKPSNAFIRSDGGAVLLDFGIAARVGDPSLTLQSSVLGTPWYMAPEQARGSSGPSPSLDVYGLAATLYHLVTLRAPHGVPGAHAGIAEVLAAARDRDPLPASVLHRGLPRDLAAILDVGLAPDPRHRYASVAAMAADLHAFLEHRPVVARPIGPLGRTLRRIRRHKARTLAIAGTATAVVFAGLLLPLVRSANAEAAGRERTDLLTHLPADLCIEGWPDQRLLVALDERTRVIAQLDRLVELDRDDLGTRMLRAAERLDAGDRSGAADDFRTIAERSVDPYLTAAAERYAHADSSRAGCDAVNLVDLPEPTTDAGRFIAGFHALRSRDTLRAQELLDRAVDYLPARDLRLLALLANAQWETAASEAHWLEGHYGHPTARTRHTLAAAALGVRHYQEAERFAQGAIALRPDRHGPWNNLAWAQLRLGRRNEAADSFRKAISLRPWFDNSRAGLCQVLRTQERFEDARAEARQIGAEWWRCWELANVDLAEALEARRHGDEKRRIRLAEAAAIEFERAAADPSVDNGKRKSAPGSIAFARAVAQLDYRSALAAQLAAMRADPLNPTQILNLAQALEPGEIDTDTMDALRLWLCEVGLDVAPDDRPLIELRDSIRAAARARQR
ncbi:MAG: protein kinase [Planctomycetota bacterium]